MEDNKNRTIVIGLDGATFDVLNPLIEKGLMPNLEKLKNEGASGVLRSTFPPTTAPAWTTSLTGKNPDEHGLFDFRKPLHYTKTRALISSKDIKAERIWNILNKQGKITAIINVPMTYPPEKVNGMMVSGFLTPARDSRMIYPVEMFDDFINAVPDYEVDIMHTKNWHFKDCKTILKRQGEILTARIAACKYAMRKFDWDFFMVVLEDMDRIQHVLWDCFNKKTERKYMEEYYSFIDSKVGELISYINGKCNIVLISDHGFRGKSKLFYVNTWLSSLNLFDCKKSEKRKSYLRKLDIFNLRRVIRGTIKTPNLDFSSRTIWENTKAYSGNWSESGIYINLKDREPYGIVDKDEYEELREFIIREITKLSNGKDGNIVKRAFKREEMYSGTYSSHIPDILIEVHEDYLMDENISQGVDVFKKTPSYKSSGHDENGIVIIHGSNIKRGNEIINSHIRDITPTILHAYGLPVPEDMQGSVLKEIFI